MKHWKILASMLSAAMLSIPTPANAFCVNPLGCKPRNLSECRQQAAEQAKTETGLRVLLAECYQSYPDVSEDECKLASVRWAAWMRDESETQPTDPTRSWKDIRARCDKWFPGTFSDSQWLSRPLCDRIAKRVAEEDAAAPQATLNRNHPRCKNTKNPNLDDLAFCGYRYRTLTLADDRDRLEICLRTKP